MGTEGKNAQENGERRGNFVGEASQEVGGRFHRGFQRMREKDGAANGSQQTGQRVAQKTDKEGKKRGERKKLPSKNAKCRPSTH